MTMYRLMVYYLIFLIGLAIILSFVGLLPFNFLDILESTVYLVVVCVVTNKLLAKIFKVSTNPESSLISALILSLIIGPGNLQTNFLLLTSAGFAAISSKYLIAWKGRHIFNPAAFGATFVAIVLHQGASWWIGNIYTLPVVLFGGFLVLRKIKRFTMAAVYILSTSVISAASPVPFFVFVMLPEPATSPYKSNFQILYALLAAAAFWLFGSVLKVFFPLELSLLVGNIFAYIVNGSFRQVLKLKEKRKESHNVTSFVFEPWKKIEFKAGQYLEWTLAHSSSDSRGIRRYFTIASSPTENFIMLTTKFSDQSSSFKTALQKLEQGGEIIVSNLEGEFTLPKDLSKKLVFLAGGIGITPFRSMIKYLIDTGEKRNIVLLFSNKTSEDIVFKEILIEGEKKGLRTVYVNTDEMGYLDEDFIKKEISDWKERLFFVSGPEPMVEAFRKMLFRMGLPKNQIKTDYFPGYA